MQDGHAADGVARPRVTPDKLESMSYYDSELSRPSSSSSSASQASSASSIIEAKARVGQSRNGSIMPQIDVASPTSQNRPRGTSQEERGLSSSLGRHFKDRLASTSTASRANEVTEASHYLPTNASQIS